MATLRQQQQHFPHSALDITQASTHNEPISSYLTSLNQRQRNTIDEASSPYKSRFRKRHSHVFNRLYSNNYTIVVANNRLTLSCI